MHDCPVYASTGPVRQPYIRVFHEQCKDDNVGNVVIKGFPCEKNPTANCIISSFQFDLAISGILVQYYTYWVIKARRQGSLN